MSNVPPDPNIQPQPGPAPAPAQPPYPDAASKPLPYPTDGSADLVNGQLPWHRQPLPSIAVGVVLILVAIGFAVLWVGSGGGFFGARAIGYAAGAFGIYLVYGGVMGLKGH
jgi:hypothetical protein